MQTRNITQIVQITTCDPSTRTIQGQQKDQNLIAITIKDIPMFFRWPEVGEMWRIQQRSNNWYLQGRIALSSDKFFIEDLTAGEAFADASTIYLKDGSQVLTSNGNNSGNQPGDLVFSGADTRIGSLLCNGSSYNPKTYPLLYTAIGTKYGGTSSSPLLPNLQGRLPLGAGTSTATGATEWAVGQQPTTGAGGEQTHKLDIDEMPVHTHGVTDDGHTHEFALDSSHGSSNGSVWVSGDSSPPFYGEGSYGGMVTTTSNLTGLIIAPEGNNGPHNTMPPVSVGNWFIVTG